MTRRLESDDSARMPPTDSTPAGLPDAKFMPTIPGYEFIKEVKRAGQGVIYQAIQQSTHRTVAIKMLRDDRPVSESALSRFQREVRLIAQLKHPNIIVIFDSGTSADGRRYYVMEYVHGQPLHEYFQAKKLTITSMVRLFLTICRAVAAAHYKGIVHHDLKPSNVLVEGDGIAKLLDFGLSKVLSGPSEIFDDVTGRLPGTLPYMSPEQTHREPDDIDTRSDVYGLGVMLYEFLTGRHPYPSFPVVDIAETVTHIRDTVPDPPSLAWTAEFGIRPDAQGGGGARCPIDDDLDFIVLKTLAKDRDHRHRDAAELSDDLELWLRGEPIPPRRDDVVYLLKKRVGRFVGRNGLIAHAMVAVMVFLLAWSVGIRMANQWTRADAFFMKHATAMMPAVETQDRFPRVTVVGLPDAAKAVELARAESIEGVTTYVKSFRRLHGRFMEKLAESRCRAVVWDVIFTEDTEFDEGFVSGARKLLQAGAGVVVAVDNWPMDDTAALGISRAISATCHVGCIKADLNASKPWALPLIVQRPPADPRSSLALTAFTASRHPGFEVDLVIQSEESGVDVFYWKYDPTLPTGKSHLKERDRIELTSVDTLDEADAASQRRSGVMAGDVVGMRALANMPSDDFLEASTFSYEGVLSANTATLREWFAERVVVVGDPRSDATDRFPHPDGRMLAGCYAHATMIDRMLPGLARAVPRGVSVEWPTGVAIALGSLLGWRVHARPKRRAWIALALTVLGVGASLFFSWKYGYLCNPLIPIVALWIASECNAGIEHVARPRAT